MLPSPFSLGVFTPVFYCLSVDGGSGSSALDPGFQVDWALATKNTNYALSSITYEDREAAVDYLQKAINLLTTGHE